LTEALHDDGRRFQLGGVYLHCPERLPRELQAQLAQRLQSGDGPRLFAGSAAVPEEEMRAGRLLPELYCRVSAVTIALPALRDRIGDLPSLVERLLPRAAEAAATKVTGVAAETLALLQQHDWPGNLDELHETLTTACQRAQGERIAAGDLPFYLQRGETPPSEPALPLDEILEKVERRLIDLALRLSKQNKTRAAELLKIWRPRLVRRLEQFGVPADDERDEAAPQTE
jgi:DNA-binding NtrC family response regulator